MVSTVGVSVRGTAIFAEGCLDLVAPPRFSSAISPRCHARNIFPGLKAEGNRRRRQLLSPAAAAPGDVSSPSSERPTRTSFSASQPSLLVAQGAGHIPSPSGPSSFPHSIMEISNGDHILGFGADLGPDHPGFFDEEYKRRRSHIADLAKQYRDGDPIPHVSYTPDELSVWRTVLCSLLSLYPTHACAPFLHSLPLMGFSTERVPQLQELSEKLHAATGWCIRPVAGLLHPRDFLNGLAFKIFHSTQYMRHISNPMYTPEPDLCHEVLGHVPMLSVPAFAELARAIGVASLGASEKEIWHLTKLYWYTVEFGTILEGGQVKAFGAGLLSSYGELEYMRSGAQNGQLMPSFQPLDPFSKLPKMSYKDGFQKAYFLCSSFDELADKLRVYGRSILREDVAEFVKELEREQQQEQGEEDWAA